MRHDFLCLTLGVGIWVGCAPSGSIICNIVDGSIPIIIIICTIGVDTAAGVGPPPKPPPTNPPPDTGGTEDDAEKLSTTQGVT